MLRKIYYKQQYFINLFLFIFVFFCQITIQWAVVYQNKSLFYILLFNFFDFISLTALLPFLIMSNKWALRSKLKMTPVFMGVLIVALGPSLHFLFANVLKLLLWNEGYQVISFDNLIRANIISIIVVITLITIFYLTRFRIQYNKQREETIKAELLAKDTQNKMLRYQINPHFLFNMLNSLHALIDESSEKAKKLVLNVSEYYRSTLITEQHENTISQEIEIVEKYLEIQKIRFEEDLSYEINIDKKAKMIQIPSFIIHLLVENAIKHGMMCFNKLLAIIIDIKIDKNTLILQVANSGRLIEANEFANYNTISSGTGIENLKKRLGLFFDNNFVFSLTEENNQVIAKIEIAIKN